MLMLLSDKSNDEACDEPDAAIVPSESEEEEDKVSLLSEEESSQHPDTQPMFKSTGLDLTSEDS